MSRVERLLIYGAVALVVLSVAVTAAFFVVNAGDEELSAEAAQMLAVRQSPYATKDNLHVALAGLDAPQGESPISAGEKWLAEQDRIASLRSKERKAAYDKAEDERSHRLRMSGNFDCRPAVLSCWKDVEARAPEHSASLAANAELYRRYLQLHAMPGYFDTARSSMGTVSMYVPPPLRTLFIEDIALRVQRARTAPERSAALAVLDSDIRTWRTVLTGEGNLVSKFVALFNLHADYALLADISGDSRVGLSTHLGEIEAIVSRMSPNDWKITGALDYEFRMLAAVFDDIGREQGLLAERL